MHIRGYGWNQPYLTILNYIDFYTFSKREKQADFSAFFYDHILTKTEKLFMLPFPTTIISLLITTMSFIYVSNA